MKTPEIPNLNTTGKHKVDISKLAVSINPQNFKYLSPEYIDYYALSISEVGDLKRESNVEIDIKKGQVTYIYEGHPYFSSDPNREIEDIFHEKEQVNDMEINVDNPVPSF